MSHFATFTDHNDGTPIRIRKDAVRAIYTIGPEIERTPGFPGREHVTGTQHTQINTTAGVFDIREHPTEVMNRLGEPE